MRGVYDYWLIHVACSSWWNRILLTFLRRLKRLKKDIEMKDHSDASFTRYQVLREVNNRQPWWYMMICKRYSIWQLDRIHHNQCNVVNWINPEAHQHCTSLLTSDFHSNYCNKAIDECCVADVSIRAWWSVRQGLGASQKYQATDLSRWFYHAFTVFSCAHSLWSRIHVQSCYMFYFGSLYWGALKVRSLQTCRLFLYLFLVFPRFIPVARFSHDSFCARASRCKWQTLWIVWICFQFLVSSEFTWFDSVCSLSLRSLSAWRVLHGDVGLDAGAILLQVCCDDAVDSCSIHV